ncbi:YfcC family protein [Phocicoccus pinnipedialis]|nr:Na+/H+ antiporter NhaC family protein [Jeotgalicoccus pinnipedialis]MBP1939648.1 putative ion transporter superfamily protein YfcC [Jeotgalicoccus pinnipedialis]
MNNKKNKKEFKMPHIYVILFVIIAFASLLSYIIPAGTFDREEVDGVTQIIPNTFHVVESNPVSFFEFMTSIPRGIQETVIIIFGILAIGAMFKVLEKSGIINLAIDGLMKAFGNKKVLIIPVIAFALALIVSLTGMIESSLIFLPALIPLFLKLGYDRLTATGTILISTVVGFTVGLTPAANLGTAQTIAELPLFSGMGYRALILVVMLTIGIFFVILYTRRMQKHPKGSLLSNADENDSFLKNEAIMSSENNKRVIFAAVFFLLSLGFMFYGIFVHKWYFIELSGFYILSGLISGLIAGLKPSEIAEAMNDGMKQILLGALIVGVARAISIVLADGQILDTMINSLSSVVTILPDTVVPVAMMIVQGLINFLIPSGSGQAAATMPIMIGLVDLTNMTRQTAVLAFLMGDGFSNIFYPTSGYFMAALAIAKIKYNEWLKFIWPLLIVWYVVGAIFLVIAQLIQYGPF